MPPQSCLVVGIADGDTLTTRYGAKAKYLDQAMFDAEITAGRGRNAEPVAPWAFRHVHRSQNAIR